ncbi:MAG: tetratricopeptide repeat protein [Dysgonamonadaceae bacterium]|jgi:tetratricopeptide (TPR) repeat protein|nr:tetratricopeptide repeat protein [Dysgonamonadaceae bacterium]
MLNFNKHFDYSEEEESYPDFFNEWDEAVRNGRISNYYQPEELVKIIEIYLYEGKIENGRHAINHALALHSEDEDLLCYILSVLEQYELWNDLLALCNKYPDNADIDGECYKLTALVHLGMEDEAFHWFGLLKKKYSAPTKDDRDMLGMIYSSMCEVLFDLDLNESCDEIAKEAISIIGEDSDFLWIRMQNLVVMKQIKEANAIADKIQKLFPLDAESWHNLGNSYYERDDCEKAIDAYENALSLGYDSQETLLNLIFTYDENGNPGKALERLTDYFEKYESNYILYSMAAKICGQLELWSKALFYINAAIEEEPVTDDSLYIYKSTLLVNLSEYRKAKIALSEGIEKTKDPEGKLKKELQRLNKQFRE